MKLPRKGITMTESAAAQVLLVVELTIRPGAQREMHEALDRLVERDAPGGSRGGAL